MYSIEREGKWEKNGGFQIFKSKKKAHNIHTKLKFRNLEQSVWSKDSSLLVNLLKNV